MIQQCQADLFEIVRTLRSAGGVRADCTAGTKRAISTPIMAMTTRTSTRVNARRMELISVSTPSILYDAETAMPCGADATIVSNRLGPLAAKISTRLDQATTARSSVRNFNQAAFDMLQLESNRCILIVAGRSASGFGCGTPLCMAQSLACLVNE